MQSSRGFTLLEILVVVAIIALLVAVLVPTLAQARRQAQTIMCAANLRTSGMGVNYYAQADGDRYPSGGWWAEVSRVYMQRLSAGKRFVEEEGQPPSWGMNQTVEFYNCPDDPIRHPTASLRQNVAGELVKTRYRISYTMNGFIGRYKLSEIKRPGTTFMLTDGGNDGVHFIDEIRWDFDDNIDPSYNSAVLEVHHRTGNNFIFADLHTEYKNVLSREPFVAVTIEDYIRHIRKQGIPPFPWHWTPDGKF